MKKQENKEEQSRQEQSRKELVYREFVNREDAFRHTPIRKEMQFYDYVKAGDEKGVLSSMEKLGAAGSGRLSDDETRNIRYHFIVTIAMMTRICVDGGMEMEEAYNLSDMYIMKMDQSKEIREIHRLHDEAVLTYTRRMKQLAGGKKYSREVTEALDYIYGNLHAKIRLQEVAEAVHVSVSCLSRLFREETGCSPGSYILQKRIETAKNMLRYSDYSLDEISNYLAFSSASHFIHVFRQQERCTPGAYRKRTAGLIAMVPQVCTDTSVPVYFRS